MVSYLQGETVGDRRPWPGSVHSLDALQQVAGWVSWYKGVVVAYEPSSDAVWRNSHGTSGGPGVVIAYNNATPYNGVWESGGLVGFID